MDIGVIGVNYKSADLSYRESLVKNLERINFSKFWHPFSKVIVDTCNRFEVYFHSPNLTETHSHLLHDFTKEINQKSKYKLYSYFGKDCFEHLAKVTSGIDSAIFGETEIQGQIKTAYQNAHEFGIASKELHFLFQKSLKIGKEIRSKIGFEKKESGLIETIINLKQNLKVETKRPKILFVGASKINMQILKQLSSKEYDIHLTNRTMEKALNLAKTHGIKPYFWNQLNLWDQFDGIILATKSHKYLIEKKEVKTKKLIIDLSVPRNADPLLTQNSNIKLLNIDQINKMVSLKQQCKRQKAVLLEKEIERAVLKQKLIFEKKSTSIQKYLLA